MLRADNIGAAHKLGSGILIAGVILHMSIGAVNGASSELAIPISRDIPGSRDGTPLPVTHPTPHHVVIPTAPQQSSSTPYTPPPQPTHTPPPETTSTATHTTFVPPPTHSGPFSPAIVLPTDVTNSMSAPTTVLLPPGLAPITDGIIILPDKNFPQNVERGKNKDQILVRAKDSAVFERPSPHAVKLVSGTILVSVRKPSELGLINTEIGDIAVSSDGELLVTENGGTVHILNASARGAGCKIQLRSAIFDRGARRTFAIAPGYEFVAGKNKLRRADLRPSDGIARRRSQVLEDGRIALSEFSLETLLQGSDLLANMNQKDSGAKERRIIADLSKMAAVLNQVNGTQGFSYSSPSRLAGTTQPH